MHQVNNPIHREKKQSNARAQIFIAITAPVMIAINIFSRARLGVAFASCAPELWYVFHVRVSFDDYMLRFVGSADDVMDAVSCFYSYKSNFITLSQ